MPRPGSWTEQIAQYERSRLDHRSGTVDSSVLEVLEHLVQAPLTWTMETGCGKSTILLSNLSQQHHVFAFDDRGEDQSSVDYFQQCPVFRADRTRLILGATQRTVPTFTFPDSIDLAFLDGPHAFPFPELEYYFVYPHLRPGGWLVIDDVHIPTIHQLFRFLAEDEMFELVKLEKTTAFFRRTAAPTFSAYGDGWPLQRFNQSRFPVDLAVASTPQPMSPPPPPPLPPDNRTQLQADLRQLQSERAELEKAVAWWQHVAEERRLKRRLARRLATLGRWIGHR